jgi:hypothetical protein
MNRRKFLAIAGSSGVILAAAGIGGFVTTRSPESALQPWNSVRSGYPDPMRRALSYAILAPNPHNRQPWVVDLKSDTEATLGCDLARLLPETDPFDRQIVIGLGCFLELFSLAAGQDGFRAEIELFPQGEPENRLDDRPIAHLRLVADTQLAPDPLFAYALQRRTNRNPYDTTRPVSAQDLEAINATVGPAVISAGTVARVGLQQLRDLSQVALRDEINDAAAFGESVDLMRIGRAEIEANPDGISIGGPFLEALGILGVVSREAMADPNSSSFQIGLDMADEQAQTAMGFLWINTLGNTRGHQIAAGRAYLRQALGVASLGLSMQPMSQALQEYPAMAGHLKRVHELLAESAGERVQMLARIGYADTVPPSPRWALSTRIKQTS